MSGPNAHPIWCHVAAFESDRAGMHRSRRAWLVEDSRRRIEAFVQAGTGAPIVVMEVFPPGCTAPATVLVLRPRAEHALAAAACDLLAVIDED